MQKIFFFLMTIITFGNFYSYHKGKKNAQGKIVNDKYDDFYFYKSRPVNGNAKRGTNY